MASLYRAFRPVFLRQAIEVLYSYPLRSFFCLLGISLGIVSITLIIASIDGANRKANEMLSDFGPDSIMVFSGSEQMRAARLRRNTITLDDMDEIRNRITGCYETIPMSTNGRTLVEFGGNKWQPLVIGSTIDYFTSWGWRISHGVSFSEEDINERSNVTVLGFEVVKNLFDGDPSKALGQTVLVNKKPVVVVGVMKERGISFGRFSLDDRIIIPLTTLMFKFQKEYKYITVVRARFTGDLPTAVSDVTKLLRQRHGITEGQPDDFTIRTAEDAAKFLLVMKGTLSAFLGITGSIALIVGGFVMANLFMISVQERRKEIGIRRAFGANQSHIVVQFLVEAVILSLAGCFTGLLLGLLAGKLITTFTSIPIMFSFKIFWVSSVVSAIVGVAAGIYPARRAAMLDPVDALRT